MQEFETIFTTLKKQLVYFAERLVGPTYAEDLVADAFLALHKSGDFSGAKSYLYKVVRNACLNHIKHNLITHRIHGEILQETSMVDAIEIKSELIGNIWNLVEGLSEMEKKVIQGIFINDLSVKELSGILKITVDTVRVYKMRALKRLRVNLSPTK